MSGTPEPLQSENPWPVNELDLVLLACDPGQPLWQSDSRYDDFNDLRQSVSTNQFRRELLARRQPGQFLHACFSGHRGSGKSTELLKLKEWADSKGFLTVWIQVDEAYGLISLESADFFLLAARTAEEAMEEFGAPLPQEKLHDVVRWFAEVVQDDTEKIQSELKAEAGAQLGGGLPFSLGKLFVKFTAGLKASSDHAIKIHQRLRNYPDSLRDRTRELFDSAAEILREKGRPNGLLLLFDNLDRYEPEVIDRALFRGDSLIDGLACHAIFTIPIALEYDALSGVMRDYYSCAVVLPMLSLRSKAHSWKATVAESAFDEKAVAIMRDALAKRIAVKSLFERPDDADLLIKMSGGCIRDLMHLVTLAYSVTESESQLTTKAAEKAIHQMRATYLRQLNPDDYVRLAHIARNKTLRAEADDKETSAQRSRLLFRRYALEYLGENDEPWIDVHPLVVETEEFQRAIAASSSLTSS